MDTTIKVQLKQAVKTESQWFASDIVIPDGCMAISSDKDNAYKIGNGTSRWSELEYAKAKASDVYDWAKQPMKPDYNKVEIGLANVDNKSSETIRSEITQDNIQTALGYVPTKVSIVRW